MRKHTFFVLLAVFYSLVLPVVRAQSRKSLADRKDTIFIFMQEFGTTKNSDLNPVLTTVGAGSCIVVTLYDKESGVGTMTHLSPMTDARNLSEAFRGIISSMFRAGYKDGSRKKIEVRLIGGYKGSSDELLERIQSRLDSLGFSKPVEMDYGDFEAESVALDTRTGELFDLVDILPFTTESKEERLRFQILKMRALLPYVNYTQDKKALSYKVHTSAQ